MAVRIRLRRIGKRKQPQYRLVVAEATAPRDGRFIETIGHYNPRLDPPRISVQEERALTWLRQGAQPSDTVRSLLVKTGVWEKFTGEAPPAAAPAAPAAAAPEAEASEVSEAAPEAETEAAGGEGMEAETESSPAEASDEAPAATDDKSL